MRYEPVEVALSGTLVRKTYTGPPNFESIAQGDRAETGYYLKLASPICIKAEEHEDGGDHDNIKEIQLVIDQEQYSALRPKLGKRVFLTGTLYEAFNGHHHTPVLLTVKK